MKKLFTILLISLSCINAFANTYYFSATGNDSNTGTDTAHAFQTLAKLNSIFSTRHAGDVLLLRRGDTFYGNITVTASGSAGNPIVISAYGTGANPVITGFTTVSGWTNIGGNIWESAAITGGLSTCNMVKINGVNTAMGRTPNLNATNPYFNVDAFNATSHTLTSSTLAGSWVGAHVILREGYSSETKYFITAQSSTTITYAQYDTGKSLGSPNSTGFGFFIQNSVSTLDQQGEWYYNPTSKKLDMYSTSAPANVQATTLLDVVINAGKSFITMDGLNFTGADSDIVALSGSTNNIVIKNCNISFAGKNGIEITGGTLDSLYNSGIANVGNAGLFQISTYFYIHNDNFYNIGIVHGQSNWSNRANAIFVSTGDKYADIQNNIIRNVGGCGIVSAAHATVKYNFVDSVVVCLTDFGGIYSGGNYNIIDHNIITNVIGYTQGTNRPTTTYLGGIYLDEGASNNVVTFNTCAFASEAGLKLHSKTSSTPNSNGNRIENNTFFNNGYAGLTTQTQLNILNQRPDLPFINDTIRYNICFSKSATQFCFSPTDLSNNLSSIGLIDHNYYIRPIDNGRTISVNNGTISNDSLVTWVRTTRNDSNTVGTPVTITDTSDIIFVYNATPSAAARSLSFNYKDARSTNHSGSITLQPFESAVLIKNGAANIPPTVNAGTDQTITLPTNSTTLSGSAADADGSIVNYGWQEISGPNSAFITDFTQPVTNVGSLIAGVYIFQLTAFDNSGASASDIVQITVNGTSNISPIAHVVTPLTISLPTSVAMLTGSGTDADGTISAYLWTKVSGPGSTTILNNTTTTPTVTGLQLGTYVFQLRVTDNQGATGTATVTLVVVNNSGGIRHKRKIVLKNG